MPTIGLGEFAIQRNDMPVKRYYAKHRKSPENLRNSGQKWTFSETHRIIAPLRPLDSVLAKRIGRSVQAVQERRRKVREIARNKTTGLFPVF